MICVLEKDLLDDKFIDKRFIKDISTNERILFNNKNIYYFGNYKKDSLKDIKSVYADEFLLKLHQTSKNKRR
jgi:hypothetical protein